MGSYTLNAFANIRIARDGILTAIAIVLFLFESILPRPLPWVKPGLANIIALYVLLNWGIAEAFYVNCARIVVGSLILGHFLSPAFLLSLGGGLAAIVFMSFGKPLGFGPVGLSILGAVGHNLAQVVIAGIIIVEPVVLFRLLPLFLLSSLITGLLTGLIIALIIYKIPLTSSLILAQK